MSFQDNPRVIDFINHVSNFVVAIETQKCDGSTKTGNGVLLVKDRILTVSHLIHHAAHANSARIRGQYFQNCGSGLRWEIQERSRLCCGFSLSEANGCPKEETPDLKLGTGKKCEIKLGTDCYDGEVYYNHLKINQDFIEAAKREIEILSEKNGFHLQGGICNMKNVLAVDHLSITPEVTDFDVVVITREFSTNNVVPIYTKVKSAQLHPQSHHIVQLKDYLLPGCSGAPVFTLLNGRFRLLGLVYQSQQRYILR
jgi:hypothetical protein